MPRLGIAQLPTPLHRAERLSRALGGPEIWFKRDDLTGFGFGGNKVRSLDLVVAEAVREHADVLVTGGRAHSNHVRVTLAAAAHLGLDAVAVLMGEPRDPPALGNLLLNRLFGGDLVPVPPDEPSSIDRHIEQQVRRLAQEGRRPFAIGRGGACGLGCAAYVDAAFEIAAQLTQLGLEPDVLYCATGSCATQAGLALGASVGGMPWKVTGVTVSRCRSECLERLKILAAETTALLALERDRDPVFDIRQGYIGPGYGRASRQGLAAISRVARAEGIVLDPVYTGKAMAALIDDVANGRLDAADTVLFLHSGGSPNLFDSQIAEAVSAG